MCVSTILNYVPVDVQQRLFEKPVLESLVACVGEGLHMYSMHALNYFCSYPVSICVFFALIGLYSQHVRAGERRSALSQRENRRGSTTCGHAKRQHLMQLHHDGPGFVLLFILLHFRLQTLVVLQGLLPTFHRHVEAGEDAAVPETSRKSRQFL